MKNKGFSRFLLILCFLENGKIYAVLIRNFFSQFGLKKGKVDLDEISSRFPQC